MINEGTKLSQYILEGDKGYRVRAQWGIRTDTLDTTGEVLETLAITHTMEQVVKEAMALQGEMEVEVPIYSAIKIQGKKLYEYAREDKAVEIPKKLMKFWDVTLVEQTPEWAEFDIKCTKGSYIRTWVDLLGKKLGSGAAMSALRRTWSSPYTIDQALTLENLEKIVGQGQENSAFVAMDRALPMVKRIRVKGQDQVLLGNGQISHDLRTQLISLFQPTQDQYIQVISQEGGRLLALIGLEPGKGFALRRVFKY
ncbi:tRNA pseudouridine synthase B [compost metagenome]